MDIVWVVEPMPGGWCRAWEVTLDGPWVLVTGEFWADTAGVLWPEVDETLTEVPAPAP